MWCDRGNRVSAFCVDGISKMFVKWFVIKINLDETKVQRIKTKQFNQYCIYTAAARNSIAILSFSLCPYEWGVHLNLNADLTSICKHNFKLYWFVVVVCSCCFSFGVYNFCIELIPIMVKCARLFKLFSQCRINKRCHWLRNHSVNKFYAIVIDWISNYAFIFDT